MWQMGCEVSSRSRLVTHYRAERYLRFSYNIHRMHPPHPMHPAHPVHPVHPAHLAYPAHPAHQAHAVLDPGRIVDIFHQCLFIGLRLLPQAVMDA